MDNNKIKNVVKGSIKTIDRASIASQKMKQAYINTKEKAENAVNSKENNAYEYASDKVEIATRSTLNRSIKEFDRQGRKSVTNTKNNYFKIKEGIKNINKDKCVNNINLSKTGITNKLSKNIKSYPNYKKDKVFKILNNRIKRNTTKSLKTSKYTVKTGVKTSKYTANTFKQTAKTSTNMAKRTFQTAKGATKKTANIIKGTVKITIKTIKAIIIASKSLVSAIIAGGWLAVIIIIIMCLIGFIANSFMGIFFSGEDSNTGQTIQTVIREIEDEYNSKIDEISNSNPHDILEIRGKKAIWKDVLSVYAVKVSMDTVNPQEVVTINDDKKQLLKDIFWDMNSITSQTEEKTETIIIESSDPNGNIIETETTVTRTYLYIMVTHKAIDDMASLYEFSQDNKNYLSLLLKEENNSLWSAVLYGISDGSKDIVKVALSQVGNIGGQPYWSWYGFSSRVEWCATFVSWCANECGYIDNGILPKFASCRVGINWFKDRNRWADNNYQPTTGDIIFFDWERDGVCDHVGIVEKVENGTIYTIEGNSNDACKKRSYSVGSSLIYGYGIPQY